MKKTATILFLLISVFCLGQEAEEKSVRKAVDDFFAGFHQKDRAKMQNAVVKNVVMQTVAKDQMGNTVIRSEIYDDFVNSILSIPDDAQFEEKLSSVNVQIDGNMAHVWAPYGFWFNNQFSHCGVNSIQLVKLAGHWKIAYLMDTRRKENCNQEQ